MDTVKRDCMIRALKQFAEPSITKSKNDTTNSRRVVFSHLPDKNTINELFQNVSVKVADRPGGYTRIIKLGNRPGDNAEMCFIELVDYNETYTKEEGTKKRTRRSRRGGGSKANTETQAPQSEAKTEETAE